MATFREILDKTVAFDLELANTYEWRFRQNLMQQGKVEALGQRFENLAQAFHEVVEKLIQMEDDGK